MSTPAVALVPRYTLECNANFQPQPDEEHGQWELGARNLPHIRQIRIYII